VVVRDWRCAICSVRVVCVRVISVERVYFLAAGEAAVVFLVASAALAFFGAAVFFAAPSAFLTAVLALAAVVVFFVGAFLVTPVGLLLLVAVAFFGPLFAPVLALARFLVVVAVGSGKVGKTLGREFPVAERVPSRAIVSV